MEIVFHVSGQSIIRLDSKEVAAGSNSFLRARFKVSADWLFSSDPLVLKAVFEKDGRAYHVLLDDDLTCEIAHEVLTECGFFHVGLVGLAPDGSSSIVRATTVRERVKVERGTSVKGENSVKPTPDELEQITAKLAALGLKLSAIETTGQMEALCQIEGVEYRFVWLAPDTEYENSALKQGYVYTITYSDDVYTLIEEVSLRGPQGFRGDRGAPGEALKVVQNSSELKEWCVELPSDVHFAYCLAGTDFEYSFALGSSGISGNMYAGDVWKFSRADYSFDFCYNIIGTDGKDGKDGATGATGAPGKDGKDGATGATGAPGKDGPPGKDGYSVKPYNSTASLLSDVAVCEAELLYALWTGADNTSFTYTSSAYGEQTKTLMLGDVWSIKVKDFAIYSTTKTGNIRGANGEVDATRVDPIIEEYLAKNPIKVPAALSDLTDDPNHRTVTDNEKAMWSAKENAGAATATVNEHNTSTASHNDIRLLIEGVTTRLNTLADSDDITLDQMSEIVKYIKSNKSLIDSITTNKVNVSDIIDDLITNVANKPLSAAQGVVLKALVESKLDASKLDTAIDNALAEAKANGEFDGEDGYSPTVVIAKTDGVTTIQITDKAGIHTGKVRDGEGGKSAYAYAQDGGYTGTEAEFATKLASGSLQVTFEVSGVADDGMIPISSDKTVAECIAAYKNGAAVYSALDPTGNTYSGVMNTCDESATIVAFELACTIDLSKRLCIVGMIEDGVDTWLGLPANGATTADIPTKVSQLENDSGYAVKKNAVYYIEGDSTTAGVWTGTCEDITEYYDGLMIHYKMNVAGVSGGSTLNINGLGAVAVKRNATTAVTTTYAVNSVLNLTYTTTDGTPYWVIADYDANTKTSAASSNKTGIKMYLVGATSQNSSGVTTYSNKNCYIGADDRLYSGGKKVAVEEYGRSAVSVKEYGAVGDGTTDDTAAFQNALAENRAVFVPGGTYKLSGELDIRHHCELSLAIDTVLNFTQTTGNCINLGLMSTLKGNHGVINVPYAFTGNVINIDDRDVTAAQYKSDVLPWIHYSPQHKYGRFVGDISIGKVDGYGIHRSSDGWSGGTALYITTDSQYDSHSIWAAHFYNILIAGAFSYGIHAINYGNGWNHDMRIETTVEACEIGVAIENCHCSFIDAVIQPVKAADGTLYAKHGIKLVDSLDADLSRSRVWDWNTSNTLWSSGGVNQHIALYGDCSGLILGDFLYYRGGSSDIRSLIYTDTASNLEKLTILQEPFTRWFKPIGGVPYFYDGNTNQRLRLMSDKISGNDTHFIQAADGEYIEVPDYTDVKSPYQANVWDNNGTITSVNNSIYIEPRAFSVGDVVRIRGVNFADTYPGKPRVYMYNKSDGSYKGLAANLGSLIASSVTGSLYNNEATYVWDATTMILTLTFDGSYASAMLNAYTYAFGGELASGYTASDVIMTVNEEIANRSVWQGDPTRLDENIYAQNLMLTSPNGTNYKLSISDSGAITAEKL